MDFSKVKKGDTVIAVYENYRRTRERQKTVRSIGRKWITTDDGCRYDAVTGGGDCGWSLYPSREALTTEREYVAAWSELRRMVDGYGRPRYSAAAIRAAIAALRAEEEVPRG